MGFSISIGQRKYKYRREFYVSFIKAMCQVDESPSSHKFYLYICTSYPLCSYSLILEAPLSSLDYSVSCPNCSNALVQRL